MLRTIIKKGSYHDSVVLMLLTNQISSMEGVKKVSIMMATPANKDILKESGLESEDLLKAEANDMAIMLDTEEDAVVEAVLKATEEFLNQQAAPAGTKGGEERVQSWEQAKKQLPNANLAVISIPGTYAAVEADRALEEGLHVFLFSDNVSLCDEEKLKKKAHEKGLLVMGPDCGTGIIQGVPVAFTNYVTPGRIGIVGASGTGIQELTTIIDRMGEGVTNAIGTGGRDLSNKIGGITMLDAINAMEEDEDTDVVVVISKPPAKEVRDKIVKRLSAYQKPVVTLFLGEKPEVHEENFYHAYTLDEAARLAVALVRGDSTEIAEFTPAIQPLFAPEEKKTIKGYYSGGTLASEAAMMIRDTLNLTVPLGKQEGYMLHTDGHVVVDLGDDVYTQGKPHPMIDPAKRAECMKEAMDDEDTGVILFDLVLGYGSHEDMAAALLPSILMLKQKAEEENRKVCFITTICGTRKDVQNYDYQRKLMTDAGVLVCESNEQAVETALCAIGYPVELLPKPVMPKQSSKAEAKETVLPKVAELLQEKPAIINIGLKSFTKVLKEFHCEVVQYDWQPPAGGNLELIQVLQYLRSYHFAES